MGLITSKDYLRMRERERSGEKEVFFKDNPRNIEEEVDLDSLYVMSPRIKRRINQREDNKD